MIDATVEPVVQKQRRVAFHLSDRAESKIKELLSQDIIERFPDNQPRSWVSPPETGVKRHTLLYRYADGEQSHTTAVHPDPNKGRHRKQNGREKV